MEIGIEDGRPIAPALVYKYVAPERTDILENGCIRFTPPLNTNDLFEVRQTFDMLAGPKMRELFEQQKSKLDFDDAIEDALAETSLAGISVDALDALVKSATGADIKKLLSEQLDVVLEDGLYPAMNEPEYIDKLLTDLGSNLICLSLSERMNSPVMWAHYADNSNGFVIAFRTENEFFQRGDEKERQGLQKIEYFDGRLSEVMDDPFKAFISKQLDWSYEREWRLYLKRQEADQSIAVGNEEILLANFPVDAVERIILGVRASEQLEDVLKNQLSEKYQHARMTRCITDRKTAMISEQDI